MSDEGYCEVCGEAWCVSPDSVACLRIRDLKSQVVTANEQAERAEMASAIRILDPIPVDGDNNA